MAEDDDPMKTSTVEVLKAKNSFVPDILSTKLSMLMSKSEQVNLITKLQREGVQPKYKT